MRTFKRSCLKRLDQKGSIIVMAALYLPLFAGVAGLAIDLERFYLDVQTTQLAANQAARTYSAWAPPVRSRSTDPTGTDGMPYDLTDDAGGSTMSYTSSDYTPNEDSMSISQTIETLRYGGLDVSQVKESGKILFDKTTRNWKRTVTIKNALSRTIFLKLLGIHTMKIPDRTATAEIRAAETAMVIGYDSSMASYKTELERAVEVYENYRGSSYSFVSLHLARTKAELVQPMGVVGLALGYRNEPLNGETALAAPSGTTNLADALRDARNELLRTQTANGGVLLDWNIPSGMPKYVILITDGGFAAATYDLIHPLSAKRSTAGYVDNRTSPHVAFSALAEYPAGSGKYPLLVGGGGEPLLDMITTSIYHPCSWTDPPHSAQLYMSCADDYDYKKPDGTTRTPKNESGNAGGVAQYKQLDFDRGDNRMIWQEHLNRITQEVNYLKAQTGAKVFVIAIDGPSDLKHHKATTTFQQTAAGTSSTLAACYTDYRDVLRWVANDWTGYTKPTCPDFDAANGTGKYYEITAADVANGKLKEVMQEIATEIHKPRLVS